MSKASQKAAESQTRTTQSSDKPGYALRSKGTAATSTLKQQSTSKAVDSSASTAAQTTANATQKSGTDTPALSKVSSYLHLIVVSLETIIASHAVPEKTKGALAKIQLNAKFAEDEVSKAAGQQHFADNVKALHNFLKADLTQWRQSCDAKLERIAADQSKILELTDNTAKSTESLKESTEKLNSKINKVNESTTRFADTAKSYRDALVASEPSPGTGKNVDPKILSDLDRKAKQVLVGFHDPTVENKSQAELKDKANDIIASLGELLPPEGAKVENVLKLRSGGAILQLNSKEAANWIRTTEVEIEFTKSFAELAHFRERHYNILVPRVPLTFDPSNQEHLREIEEANGLNALSITKARWIKPEYRRTPGQRLAHASITISSAATANKLIRDGMYICNSRVTPTKLKQEPLQCMKCRGWGHVAISCLEPKDTCGNCAGDHQTRACPSPDKRYCVSCKSDTHASWDRKCPEFVRRCLRHNERHPENNMVYFPTDEDWTLTIRPDRIPLDERFPQRYAVASLPPPNNKQRAPPTRPIAKPSKRSRRRPAADLNTEQATLDHFLLKPIQTQDASGKSSEELPPANEGGSDSSDDIDEMTEKFLNDGAIHEPTGWD
jgi:hypothetical protein